MSDCGDLLAAKHGERLVLTADMVTKAHDLLDHVLQDYAERDWRARGSLEMSINVDEVMDMRITIFDRPDHDGYPELEDMR